MSGTVASRIVERHVGSCRLLILKTDIEDVVSLEGSFLTQPDFGAGEELTQVLTVRMLDKGTRKRDRFEISDVLDSRGAQLVFRPDGLRTGFSGRMLKGDLDAVLAVLAEQLLEPAFDAEEFEKTRTRMAASFQRALDSTGSRAGGALSRALFGPAHPSYTPHPERELEHLRAYDPAALPAWHAAHFSAAGLTVVLTGDVDPDHAEEAVARVFGDWKPAPVPPAFDAAAILKAPGTTYEFVPDKGNADVWMGHGHRVRRSNPDWIPLFLGLHVLGGNFSARLMSIIRDQMGLTYGIQSGLSSVATEYDGFWYTVATLSLENLDHGVEAIGHEVRRFIADGIKEEELDVSRTTVAGSHKVGLGTTAGLASSIIKTVERDFPLTYLDDFPNYVLGTRLDDVNAVIRRHLDFDAVHTAIAGTLRR